MTSGLVGRKADRLHVFGMSMLVWVISVGVLVAIAEDALSMSVVRLLISRSLCDTATVASRSILRGLRYLISFADVKNSITLPGVDQSLPDYVCAYEERAEGSEVKETFQHKQVTDTQHCGEAAECTVGKATSYTFGWGVNAGVNTPFISAGLSVQESWTNEETHGCTEEEGESTCLWYRVKYLEYELKASACNSVQDPPNQKMWAPASGNEKDASYYCMTGNYCLHNGETFWHDRKEPPVKDRPAVSPQSASMALGPSLPNSRPNE